MLLSDIEYTHSFSTQLNGNSKCHIQTALDIHSQITCFSYRWLIIYILLPGASSRHPSTQILWLMVGEGSCSLTRKGDYRQGWGQSWAQGSQGAADAYPPTTVSSEKRDWSVTKEWKYWHSQILPTFMILVSCPCISCLWVTHSTSEYLFARSNILKKYWKTESVTREEVQYPLASLMSEHSDVVIEDTHRPDLTLMSPWQVCPFSVPHLQHTACSSSCLTSTVDWDCAFWMVL